MKKRLLALLSITIILSLSLTGVASATKPNSNPNSVFEPGETVTYAQDIPINVVFIGYDSEDVNMTDFSSWLPSTYEPLVRYPQFYGLPGRDMGLKYNFKYKYIFKDDLFAAKLFAYYKNIGVPKGVTYYQNAYNNMANNNHNVTGPILWLDAPSVEKWLTSSLHMSANSYTIVFINWYGHPKFQHHVYTKTDEGDPDTFYNFGYQRSSRKMIAWGGSNSRLWFYDLSAGPESWSGNYDVDNADLDGDAVADYRMPPIWEYSATGYRDPADLGGDLGLVTRFVGINLLFTTSPLYDPMATAPGVGGRKLAHINMMEDDASSFGPDWMNLGLVRTRFKGFQPHYVWGALMSDVNPIDAGAKKAFRIFAGLSGASDCWNPYGTPFAELFCYFDANRAAYIPPYRAVDYVAGFNAFNTTAARLGSQYGLLGFADDNWVDGTPSYVFEFGSPEYRAMGYGFTVTTIHEGGHHFGMSHPHDGYDSEFDIDYGSSGPLYFAWSGDESNTVMHYMDLTTAFGKFDRDNVGRWETAGYLNWCNELLADLQAHPDYALVSGSVNAAERYGTAALIAYNQWFYQKSAAYAKNAYWALAQAAATLGVPTPDAAEPVAPTVINADVPREGDPIRFPDN